MNTRARVILPALLLMPATSPAQARLLTADDLAALDKSGSYEELLDHVEDIPPAVRDASWQALVEKAASKVVPTLEASTAAALTEKLLRRHAFLTKSKVFAAARSDATMKGLAVCYDAVPASGECSRRALTLIDGDPVLALAVGKLAMRKQRAHLAVPVFKRATEGPSRKQTCEDVDLLRAVVAALKLPRDHDVVADARDITSKRCFAEVLDYIEAELSAAPDDSDLARNVCDILKTKAALSGFQPHPCGP